jgi:hypothetical protein
MFKGLFKLIFGLIRLAVFLVIFVLIFHTWVIKHALTFSLSYQLGADVSIQNVKMDWKNTGFEVQGLEIGNPYGFPKGTLADIPLVIVSFDVPGIPQGLLKLKALGFDLRELQVMNVSKKGLNILALKPLQRADEEGAFSPSREAVQKQVRKYAPKVSIDELIFSIGDIRYVDMSGPVLKQTRYKAEIRGATYYDIRGTEDVAIIVAAEALKKMGFGYLMSQIQSIQGHYVASIAKPNNFLSRALSIFDGKASE